MKEWFFHRIFENLGLLTTRYDFIPVTLNGENLGIFALEEHFDKQLLESRGRREGPILKVDEEGFWERVTLGEKLGKTYNIPYYEASAILLFKKKRTIKNETLKQEFLIAQNLLYQYKTWQNNIDDLFNLRALAQYHAIMDLGKVDHAQGNQRTYYNPITAKLEPIAYDLFTELKGDYYRTPISGLETMHGEDDVFKDLFFNYNVFMQPVFQKEYLKQLKWVSDSTFLAAQIEALAPEIEAMNDLLAKEYGGYTFSPEEFSDNAEQIRAKIPEYETKMAENAINFKPKIIDYEDLAHDSLYFKQTGLKAYGAQLTPTSSVVTCLNYHMGPIEIVGYSIKGAKDSLIRFSQPKKLPGYTNTAAETKVAIPGRVSRLFLTVPSMPDSLITKKVVPWNYPNTQNPRVEIESRAIVSAAHYSVKDEVITLNKRITLNNILFIPKGFTVNIQPGTVIQLQNGGGIVSYSPVRAYGDESTPINITGKSVQNQGLQVLTDNDSSIFTHVNFTGMSTLNYKGWQLTGGLTVYRGKVSFTHCTFASNFCEDAVNAINSGFTMNNCRIESTFSDGFDADFCTGTVSNCLVIDAGNDGLDFSGSTIQIMNTKVVNPFDKAVSGGEASTVTIQDSEISKASLGVASKDNSLVTVGEVTFTDCNVVYALFQKKDEYGPAKIISTSAKTINCGSNHLIDLGSVLQMDSTTVTGIEKQNVDSLYSIFRK